MHIKFWSENLKEIGNSEDLDVDARTNLRVKMVERCGLDASCSG